MEEKIFAQKLVKEYGVKEVSKVEELRALDKKVKKPAKVFAYVFGAIASLILGFGMCLSMEALFFSELWKYIGIGIGLVGILLVSITYSLYKKILNKRKDKYGDEIIMKSNEILHVLDI